MSETTTKQQARLIRKANQSLRLIKLPPTVTVAEWAERHRYLSREYTAKPQPYRLETVPYARAPMEDATNPDVRSVCLMWAAQTTKTTTVENVLAYFIAADPAPILMVQPTIEMAQAWSKERFNATVRDTPALRAIISDQKSRDSGNTIQMKNFPGGNLAIIGANAPSGLAGRARRVVLLDEVDRYPASAGTEGDPVALAIRRTESFWNGVVYLTSTPTLRGASRIESEYEQTDKRLWYVPCGRCKGSQSLRWSQVKWPEGAPELAWYECERCQAHWTDQERVDAIRAGDWRATAGFNGKRGYFLSGIYSPFRAKRGFKNRLHQMAVEFLEAKAGGPEQLKTWTNTFLAETYADTGQRVELESLVTRLEPYSCDPLPEQVLVLTAAADVQSNRIQAEVIGWGVGDESWGIETVVLAGDPEHPPVWEKLHQFFLKSYRHPWGFELQPRVCCVDSGYATKMCYRFCDQSGRDWYPVKGSPTRLRELVAAPSRKSRSKAWLVDTTAFKNTIFSWLGIDEPGPRFCHFPRGSGYGDEFFAQLTAEEKRITYKFGQPFAVYENVRPNKRNEALDIRVYNHAALYLLRPDWAGLRANTEWRRDMKKPKEQAPQAATPSPHPTITRQLPRRAWMNRWR